MPTARHHFAGRNPHQPITHPSSHPLRGSPTACRTHPTEATGTVRSTLREERVRWRAPIDEATRYLTAHFERIAFAYAGSQIPELAVRYSGNARMVWISERSEDCKLNDLRNITQHCHALFLESPLHVPQRTHSWQELERLLDELETPGGPNGG